MFDETIKFKYSWRPYQAKVLEEVNGLIQDKKVHVVAPPGSGKTVLGLELARRIGNPVLILSPTVTIKNQWIDRFVSLFMMEGSKRPDWISDDIYNLNYFNSVTYQGLHCAYKKLSRIVNDVDDTDDIVEKEKISTDIDVSTYNLIEEIKKQNIKTIVLDEAHHLKNEWWNSLVKVVESIPGVVIVALTATPPYDIPQNEWKRYIGLCGEIDTEISVPELVKEKNLCPHQDYVYFSYPTQSEKEKIKEYKEEVKLLTNELLTDMEFITYLRNHPYIVNYGLYIENILSNTEFYSSMLIFLNQAGVDIKKEHVKVLGHSRFLPILNVEWLEILLQNLLFTERKIYDNEIILEKISRRLNSIGAIEKKEVLLCTNDNLQKYFINSISKLDSIVKIVKSEYGSLNSELRMVILTDYLRNEYLDMENPEIEKMGVFPILIKLLNSDLNINMAVLTGSMFIIPNSKKDKLLEITKENGISDDKVIFENLKYIDGYSVVRSSSKLKNKLMNSISKLFSTGEVNIIIGTKSLLGEGWDEQSINSLILASFVGSFVLSNQMRGRAIRVSSNEMKTANVWHLVCVDNVDDSIIKNPDYELMKRRFNSFIGIGYVDDVIESGVDRLEIVPKKFTKGEIDRYNQYILGISNKRSEMYNRWFKLVDMYLNYKINMEEELSTDTEKMKNEFSVIEFWRLLLFFVSIVIMYFLSAMPENSDIRSSEFAVLMLAYIIAMIIFNAPFIIQCIRAMILSMPKNQLLYVGKCVVRSLCNAGFIDTPYYNIKIRLLEDKENMKLKINVSNVTTRERSLIITCLEEIFDKIEEQRYILVNKKFIVSTYYNVPNIFSTNKKLAEMFYKNWQKYIGVSRLIYTKSVDGRKLLLKARANSFDYTNTDELFKKKKRVSVWK